MHFVLLCFVVDDTIQPHFSGFIRIYYASSRTHENHFELLSLSSSYNAMEAFQVALGNEQFLGLLGEQDQTSGREQLIGATHAQTFWDLLAVSGGLDLGPGRTEYCLTRTYCGLCNFSLVRGEAFVASKCSSSQSLPHTSL